MSDNKTSSPKSTSSPSSKKSKAASVKSKELSEVEKIQTPKEAAVIPAGNTRQPKPTPINTAQLTATKKSPSLKETKVYLDGFSGTANWGQYLLTRVAIIPYLLVSFGYMLSAYYFYEVDNELFRLKLGEFFWGGFTMFLYLVLLRFMDDAKDWQTDIVANPGRPLPQGIVNPREMKNVILGFTGLLVINAVILGILVDWSAGIFAAAILAFQLLMWKEFGLGKKLEKSPLIYAIVHQPVTILHIMFALCMFHDSDAIRAIESWFLTIYFFGVSFTYEVSRKLDPHAHPALGYYRQFYGRVVTMVVLITTIGISAVGALLIRLNLLTWIADFVVLIVTAAYLFGLSTDVDKKTLENAKKLPDPDPKAKIIEIIVILSTLWHVLVIPIVGWAEIYSPI